MENKIAILNDVVLYKNESQIKAAPGKKYPTHL